MGLNAQRSVVPNFGTLQHTATNCNKLQQTATNCNTIQHTATHCNTLQHTGTYGGNESDFVVPNWNIATHCKTPQPHCNTLQHTVTHNNVSRLAIRKSKKSSQNAIRKNSPDIEHQTVPMKKKNSSHDGSHKHKGKKGGEKDKEMIAIMRTFFPFAHDCQYGNFFCSCFWCKKYSL